MREWLTMSVDAQHPSDIPSSSRPEIVIPDRRILTEAIDEVLGHVVTALTCSQTPIIRLGAMHQLDVNHSSGRQDT